MHEREVGRAVGIGRGQRSPEGREMALVKEWQKSRKILENDVDFHKNIFKKIIIFLLTLDTS